MASVSLRMLLAAGLAGACRAGPVLFWGSSPTMPNATAILAGSKLAGVTNVTLCWLSRELGCSVLPVVAASAQSVAFVVPAALRPDVYTAVACAPSGCSAAVTLNEADAWWWQSDALTPDTAFPGVSTIHVSGKALYIDRAAATCSSSAVAITGGRIFLLMDSSGNTLDVPVRASCFHIAASIPANVTAGVYTMLLNNNVLAGNGVVLGNITIAPQPAPPATTCPASSVATLLACLNSVNASGGGVVQVAAGSYSMPTNTPIVVGSGVWLVGSGVGATQLLWASNGATGAPAALLTGVGAWHASSFSMIILSSVQNAISFTSECVSCSVDSVEVYLNTSSMPTVTPRNSLYVEGATYWAFTRNVVTHVGNCSTSWPHNTCFYVGNAVQGQMVNNSWTCGCQGYSHDNSQLLLETGNTMVSIGSDSDGNGFSSFTNPYQMQFVYSADNVYVGNPNATKRWESMTFDGPDSLFVGSVAAYSVNSSGVWLTPGVGLNGTYMTYGPGMLLAVMQGTGIGQVTRVVNISADRSSYALDAPLAVAPAGDSIISILGFKGRMVWERNTWVNGTTVQLFGTSIDCVFAGNNFINMTAGLLGWGRMYQGGWQPSYRVLFQENVFTCSSELSSFTSVEPTPVPPFNFTGPFNWAHVHRANVLLGGTTQSMRGATWDSVMEDNVFAASDCGGGPGTPVKPAGAWSVDPASMNVYVRGQ